MKPRQIFTILVIVFSLLFFYSQSGAQNQNMKDKFYVGPFASVYWPFQYDWTTPHYFPSIFQPLSFNLMQSFSFHFDHDQYNLDGGFYDPISNYLSNVTQMLGKFTANFGSHSMLLEREKVLRPAFGQRSTYEAEANPYAIRPGYGFETVGGAAYSENWQGVERTII